MSDTVNIVSATGTTIDTAERGTAISRAKQLSTEQPDTVIAVQPEDTVNPTGEFVNGKYRSRVVDLSATQCGKPYSDR